MKHVTTFLVLGAILGTGAGEAFGKEGARMIENGRKVTLAYTLTVDGEVVDSSKGGEPFSYTHGEGKIIPGLSKQLEGLAEGDEKTITVAPEDAYGVVDPQAFQEVPKSRLPQGAPLQPGMRLQASTADGHVVVVKIKEVKKDSVILDFNHPLAGKTLQFQVKVLTIQ